MEPVTELPFFRAPPAAKGVGGTGQGVGTGARPRGKSALAIHLARRAAEARSETWAPALRRLRRPEVFLAPTAPAARGPAPTMRLTR